MNDYRKSAKPTPKHVGWPHEDPKPAKHLVKHRAYMERNNEVDTVIEAMEQESRMKTMIMNNLHAIGVFGIVTTSIIIGLGYFIYLDVQDERERSACRQHGGTPLEVHGYQNTFPRNWICSGGQQ